MKLSTFNADFATKMRRGGYLTDVFNLRSCNFLVGRIKFVTYSIWELGTYSLLQNFQKAALFDILAVIEKYYFEYENLGSTRPDEILATAN